MPLIFLEVPSTRPKALILHKDELYYHFKTLNTATWHIICSYHTHNRLGKSTLNHLTRC